MAADRTSFIVAEVEGGAKGFDPAAKRLLEATAALRLVLAATKGCWGGDDTGKAFAEKYVDWELTVLGSVNAVEASLPAIGDMARGKVRAMGAAVDDGAKAAEKIEI